MRSEPYKYAPSRGGYTLRGPEERKIRDRVLDPERQPLRVRYIGRRRGNNSFEVDPEDRDFFRNLGYQIWEEWT